MAHSMDAGQRHHTQDPHTSQDTTRLCLQDPHRAWSLVRDTTRRTHTPLRTPHDSAYKTRTEHGRCHTQDSHTSQDTTRLCLQDPHRAWSLVRDTTRRTHTPLRTPHDLPTRPAQSMVAATRRTLRTPHVSAYKTRTEHGHWLETLHAGRTHLSGHHTSLPTRPAQSMVAG